MEVNREKVTALTLTIICGGLTNLFLLLALVLTWRYWRQVKWYILALAAANWLELGFRFGTELRWQLTMSWRRGSQASCKALMALRLLGPSLAGMAVAAAAVHTLLTGLTGSQGGRARHLVVLGLFLLLALPVPLSQIPVFRLLPVPPAYGEGQQCVSFDFFDSPEQQFYFNVGSAVALVYFPLLVFLVCGGISAALAATGGRGDVKGDDHVSDLFVTGLLGVLMLICCVPLYTFLLVIMASESAKPEQQQVHDGLLYWEHCRNVLTALLTAGFAFLYVYRKRGETHLSPATSNAACVDRQKLVN